MMTVEHKVDYKHTVNATDKKVIVKRRGDRVYDIYVNDKHVGHRGSVDAAVEYVSFLLMEE